MTIVFETYPLAHGVESGAGCSDSFASMVADFLFYFENDGS